MCVNEKAERVYPVGRKDDTKNGQACSQQIKRKLVTKGNIIKETVRAYDEEQNARNRYWLYTEGNP